MSPKQAVLFITFGDEEAQQKASLKFINEEVKVCTLITYKNTQCKGSIKIHPFSELADLLLPTDR